MPQNKILRYVHVRHLTVSDALTFFLSLVWSGCHVVSELPELESYGTFPVSTETNPGSRFSPLVSLAETVSSSAVQFSSVQCSAVQCSAVQ